MLGGDQRFSREPGSILKVILVFFDADFVKEAFNSSRPASRDPVPRSTRATSSKTISACRFWLSLFITRKSSISGRES